MRNPVYPASQWVAEGDVLNRNNGQRIFYHCGGEGRPILMLHGFPTWSYDYAEVAIALQADYQVIVPDFLGYGESDKPRGHEFSVDDSADMIEELVRHLDIKSAHVVLHDYGGIVGQELLDRRKNGRLSFDIESLTLLNFGIVYAAYRPARIQKLLAKPIIGRFVASRTTKEKLHAGLNRVRGANKLSDAEFDEIWSGVSRHEGHKLAYRHIRYNNERKIHAARWEEALFSYDGSMSFIWGMADPVSGAHVPSEPHPCRLQGPQRRPPGPC